MNYSGYLADDEGNKYFLDDLFYKPGDTFEINAYTAFSGLLTSGCKSIHFSIPVCKSMANITKVTLDSFNLEIRHPDGVYLGDDITSIDGTINIAKRTDNLLEVAFIFNTAFSVTNNVPLSIAAHSLKISFS